jgi:hypothetical protein
MLPIANAGEDKTISMPSSTVMLEGGGTDEDGEIAVYFWSTSSGPNTPLLNNSGEDNLTVTGLIQGTYEFQLTVTDNEGATDADIVTVVVTANTAPTADAGDDQEITLPISGTTTTGSGTDTGIIELYAWEFVSGPNVPTLVGVDAATLTASGLIEGTYVFRFTVTDDGGLTDSDEVRIVVLPAPVNLALLKPVLVSSTENGTTPGSGAVDGNFGTRWSSAFSDPQWIQVDLGEAYAINQVKITWEPAYAKDYLIQLSDNGTDWSTVKTITGNTGLLNNHADVSGEGRYVRIYGTTRGTPYGYSIYELEVYGIATSGAPTVNAGENVALSLPVNEVRLVGEATSQGTISEYAWTLISGPNEPTLTGANTASVTVTDLVAGTYVFKLTVTDDSGLTASDEMTVVIEAVTDVENDQKRQVHFYPNPAKKFLYIEGLKDGAIVYITSTMGKRVGEKVVMKSVVDIHDLPVGLYILNAQHVSSIWIKFVKE